MLRLVELHPFGGLSLLEPQPLLLNGNDVLVVDSSLREAKTQRSSVKDRGTFQIKTYSDSIDRQEKQFKRLDHVKDCLQVKENVLEDLLLCDAEMNIIVVRMRAIVDDSIHIQVKIIELGNLKTKTTDFVIR